MPRGAAGDGGAASRAREDRQLRFIFQTEGRIVVKEKPGVPLLASQ